MQSSLASGHDRWRATSLVVTTWRRRESSHWVGHEQSRTDQSTADTEDQRWDHAGPPRLLRAARKAVSRDANQRARDDEVGTLQPATSTGREGTHRVTPPVVPGASRADRDEGTHEKGSGSDSAYELCRKHPRLALTRGHSGNRIGTLVTNRPSYPYAVQGRQGECASPPIRRSDRCDTRRRLMGSDRPRRERCSRGAGAGGFVGQVRDETRERVSVAAAAPEGVP